ncbi:AAA ATPase-like protein [Nocardioides sp. J9]|uniref:AAA family ATPase n=1 Tax=Nocardioides sp. J9 TaxID=935844 RepID=UPI0011A57E23|nr:AAA family ATPase [Nocardioides sp. J9]TWG97245.1 AAA ATPase-like protein [Nocardioides sp. J9]
MEGSPTRPRLVPLEREAEIARIAAAQEAARAGEGTAVLVRGPAGIGKSTLLDHAALHLTGFRVLRARCSELEQGFGLGAVRQLLERLVRQAGDGERERWFAGAAQVARGPVVGSEAADDAGLFGVLNGLYWLVFNLAEDGPVALVVDDLQWADEPSLRFLEFLAARLDGLPVLLLGATRPGVVADWQRAPSYVDVVPAPLSERATHDLLHDALSEDPTPAFVAACQHASGGVPFHVHALASTLRRDGVHPDDDAAGRVRAVAPAQIVARVLARGDDPRRTAVLRALAVLDAEPPSEVVAEVAGVPHDEAASACEELRQEGLLADDRLALAHPILAAAVLHGLPVGEVERLHRRCAEVLAAAGADVERVAAHLLTAPLGVDAWAVETLTAAAAAPAPGPDPGHGRPP